MPDVGGRARPADLVLVATLALAASLMLNVGVVCSNDGANYALIRALADGTTRIDPYREYTFMIDYSMREGHYYSPRAPGTAFVMVPFYVVTSWFTDHDGTLQLATGLASGLALAALGCLLYLVARRLSYSRAAAVVSALALCLGTPLRSYASGPWSHVLAALFAFALVAWAHEAITRPAADERAGAVRHAVGLGLLSAATVSVDYSGVLYSTVVLVIVGAVHLRRLAPGRWAARWVAPIVGSGLAGMVPTLTYHYLAFGSPFETGYDYVVGEYEQVNQLSGMYGGNMLEGLFGLLVHPRAGLFLWSPVLLAGLAALGPYLRRLGSRSAMLLFTLPAIVMTLLTANYHWWDGGGVHDVRFIAQSLPLLALPVAAAVDASRGRRWARLGLGALFALSLLLQLIKHHAYWARDGERWIPRLTGAGDRLGEVLLAFGAWCWPHLPSAAVVAAVGLGVAYALRRREGRVDRVVPSPGH